MPGPLPTIKTPRLTLRTPEPRDVGALFSIFGDPESMLYWSSPAMRELAEAEALLASIRSHAAADTLFQWGIAGRDDQLIGTCTLFRIETEHRRAELGYIVRRDLWGRGFANEALTALLAHAFSVMKLHRLEADIDPRNARSIRLVERLGFKLEGHLRERYFVGDDIQDSLMYGLIATEWRER